MWGALGGMQSATLAAEEPRDLSDIDLTHEDLKTARERWVRKFEREYLVRLLEANDGNASAAARSAGVDRKYLYRLLWRHGLR
jgi:transcriptional regulator of acetoin/glycerol metabolism